MLSEQCFHAGVVSINYAEGVTSGDPLVLLHGGSARWQSFLPLVPELSRYWHLYAPDLRGHGRSGYVPGGYRLQEYARDIATFLEQIVRKPAVLFGHSLGGQVAILVAAWYPHLVRGLIIGDAPFDRGKLRTAIQRDQQRLHFWHGLSGMYHSLEEIAEALQQTPIHVEGESEPVAIQLLYGKEHPWYREMAEQLQHNDPDMLAAVIEFEQMHEQYDYERLFPMISCPVLIIQGSPEHGGMLTNEEIERGVTLLPRATVAQMKTVGHPLHTQEKEPVLRAMEAFLKTL